MPFSIVNNIVLDTVPLVIKQSILFQYYIICFFLFGKIVLYFSTANSIWLVVYLPLWKIWKSLGMILPKKYGKQNVPNHQPDGDLMYSLSILQGRKQVFHRSWGFPTSITQGSLDRFESSQGSDHPWIVNASVVTWKNMVNNRNTMEIPMVDPYPQFFIA